MASISNLERQHREIYEEVHTLKALINGEDIKEQTLLIAKNLNLLAGKLKMHLQSEDRFLYPQLMGSSRIELKQLATAYNEDMGMIYEEFEKYKLQFNTKSKIDEDIIDFRKQTQSIFTILEERLHKEDKNLYPLIKENDNPKAL